MGLPYYGYQWSTSSLNIPSATSASGVAKTFKQVKNNVSGNYNSANYNYDTDSYTDIYAFNDGGNKQCFISTEDGFDKRLAHVNQSGIGGIGIWALGYDDGYSQYWNTIDKYLTDCYEDSCSGSIHDFGGPTRNYYNNEDYIWTISPPGATYINIDFTFFDVEDSYDYLYICMALIQVPIKFLAVHLLALMVPVLFYDIFFCNLSFYSDVATTVLIFSKLYLLCVCASLNELKSSIIYPNPTENKVYIQGNGIEK